MNDRERESGDAKTYIIIHHCYYGVFHSRRSNSSSILQAEKLGIGMVQVLRVQSGDVREQCKQRAEEEAMKEPIKMLFPLVLVIFPSLFIVLLGPAIIQFITSFSK